MYLNDTRKDVPKRNHLVSLVLDVIIVTMLFWSAYAYCMDTHLSGQINVMLLIHVHIILSFFHLHPFEIMSCYFDLTFGIFILGIRLSANVLYTLITFECHKKL